MDEEEEGEWFLVFFYLTYSRPIQHGDQDLRMCVQLRQRSKSRQMANREKLILTAWLVSVFERVTLSIKC